MEGRKERAGSCCGQGEPSFDGKHYQFADPAASSQRLDGGTTVSGTMAVAHLAGIKIFSTGGIGGVHRGAETSFDISSDLIALSDTPVAVVCAGSKSMQVGLRLFWKSCH